MQHFGEREGLSEQRALGCFRFHASLVVLRVLPGVGAGSEAQVTIVFLCCDFGWVGHGEPHGRGQAGRSLVMTTGGSFVGTREILARAAERQLFCVFVQRHPSRPP